MILRPLYAITLAAYLLTVGACKAPPRGYGDLRLPFHVAVAPVAVGEVEEAGVRSEEDALQLGLESAELTLGLARSLELLFAQVTVLPGDAAQSGPEGWLDAARAAGADLWLQAEARYEPTIHVRPDVPPWVLLPLGLGTSGRRGYEVIGSLSARLLDASSHHETPLEWTVLDSGLDVGFGRVGLNFGERAVGWSWFHSFFVPASQLSVRSRRVPESTRQKVVAKLGRELADAVYLRRHQLSGLTHVAQARLERAGDRATLELPLDQAAAPVFGYAIRAQGRPCVPWTLVGPQAEAIRAAFVLEANTNDVQLQLEDTLGRIRSFTLALEPQGAAKTP